MFEFEYEWTHEELQELRYRRQKKEEETKKYYEMFEDEEDIF